MVRIHPLISIIFSLQLFLMTLYYSNYLYTASLLGFVALSIVIMKRMEELISSLKYGLLTAILITIINPLVSNSGTTIIYKSPRLPVVGKIKITLESIAFGASMGLKLLCIFLIFALYNCLTDPDDKFVFLSKYAHKLTLLLSMTTNIIHRLKLEINRVKDVMILRGVRFNEKNMLRRLKAYYPLLKVVLISSLEGSLNRAEALYSRAYGRFRRTSYTDIRIKGIDYAVLIITILLSLLFMFSLLKGIGDYEFYPTLNQLDPFDLRYLILIHIVLSLFLIVIWRWRVWKSLKLKI